MGKKISKTMMIAVLLAAIAMPACSGVVMSPPYSERLDTAAALSAEAFKRAKNGELTEEQKTQALGANADFIQLLRDGRDGVASKNSTPVTNPGN